MRRTLGHLRGPPSRLRNTEQRYVYKNGGPSSNLPIRQFSGTRVEAHDDRSTSHNTCTAHLKKKKKNNRQSKVTWRGKKPYAEISSARQLPLTLAIRLITAITFARRYLRVDKRIPSINTQPRSWLTNTYVLSAPFLRIMAGI